MGLKTVGGTIDNDYLLFPFPPAPAQFSLFSYHLPNDQAFLYGVLLLTFIEIVQFACLDEDYKQNFQKF